MHTVGILALQGDFDKHLHLLNKIGINGKKVRLPNDLLGIDGLIIPGGESTTMGRLLTNFNLYEPIRNRIEGGMPVFGTCAGMILLARSVIHSHRKRDQPHFGALDIDVTRNAYGRQIESFEAVLDNGFFNHVPLKAVFIRAPQISRIGDDVAILAEFENKPVFVRQKNVIAASFHPELTDDTRIHEYFISLL